MAIAAEPRPAQLPLPGGRAGASVQLRPLLTGEILVPPGFVERPSRRLATLREFRSPRSQWMWLPVPAFLVEHPTAGALLVDTGLHPSVALDPQQNFGPVASRLFELRVERGKAASEQLRALGIEPARLRLVLMTHLHTDHASAVEEFPGAMFLVDGREWEAATARGGWRQGYHTPQFDYGFDWRTVDYEAPAVDSFATFGRSVDVFGDGSVRLVSTPGHSEGHQSVLLRLHDREALLTGDAAYERRTIDRRVRPLVLTDEHRYWRSLREISLYLEGTPSALVIAGHDRHEWPRLAAEYG